MAYLVKDPAGADVFVVRQDLTAKIHVTDIPTFKALLETKAYADLTLSSAQLAAIPTVAAQ
jgi:hypothetical protein